jgi:uncharacterized cupredoxin-like copper-binding protein
MAMEDGWTVMLGMMQGMPGMPATPYSGAMGPGGMMGMMEPATQQAALCAATGPFDRAFLEMMIPHHQLAIVMAEVARQRASHEELRSFAEQTMASQASEIEQMQGLFDAWYGGTPAGGTPAAAVPDVVEVRVTLTEFAVTSDLTTFEVGRVYRFVVTNAGAVEHEFMVMPKVEGMESKTMEELDAIALGMIHADHLPPGATGSLDIIFSEPAAMGQIELVCALPGHYPAGMGVPIEVTG